MSDTPDSTMSPANTSRDATEAKIDPLLEQQLVSARRWLPTWNAGRQQQLKWATLARLDEGRRRRLMPRIMLMGATAAALVGGVWVASQGSFSSWLSRTTPASPSPAGASRNAPTEVALPKLADGTSIVLDGPQAVLKKTLETPDEVGFQLESGGAHFEVARRPSRIFRVHAGPVTVQVIGTRFHVLRQAGRSRINVDRGRVLVSWWGGSQELGAGQEGTFPPENQPPAPPADAVVPVAPAATSEVAPATAPRHAHGLPAHDADAMFARADRARLDGKPELAVAELRQIVEHHPHDPHAAIAAFTMGRLLLESLKTPAEAAVSFGRARALAKEGPLGEDALAREVEALHAAGDPRAARERAELYRRRFPSGPRLHAVMRFGGLQAGP